MNTNGMVAFQPVRPYANGNAGQSHLTYLPPTETRAGMWLSYEEARQSHMRQP